MCMHAYMFAYSIYMHRCIYVCACMYICMHIYAYICIHMYTPYTIYVCIYHMIIIQKDIHIGMERMRDVAVCCSVLQGVAVCCSVLQGVAGCCRVLQGVAGCCKTYTHTYGAYAVASISTLLKINRSLLQNTVSLTGLFRKRDLSF